jgi:hypothetical protein
MSEPLDDITDQPKETPRDGAAITNESRQNDEDAYEANRFVLPRVEKNKLWMVVVVGGIVVCCCLLAVGVMMPAVSYVRVYAARSQSLNNLKQMGLAVNNLVPNPPAEAYIPPAFGVYPNGGTLDTTFFFHLVPNIEAGTVYSTYSGNPAAATIAFKTYIAPADTYNPGTSNLCSYAANANFLAVTAEGKPPRATDGGRSASTVIIAERSAKTGATWNAYLPPTNTTAPSGPFFYVYYPPTATPAETYLPIFTDSPTWPNRALGTSPPTAFTSAGCMVGMLDGSARAVKVDNIANNAWLMACDPVNNPGPMPANW